MAPRTRSTTSSPIKNPTTISAVNKEESHNPVKILVAPKNISSNARILSLRHPTDGSRRRFIFCPITGLLELKRTTSTPADPRSAIFTPADRTNNYDDAIAAVEGSFSNGFINKDAEVLTATPFDLAFVLLRFVAPESTSTKKALFQPLEDLLEIPESTDRSLRYILQNGQDLVQQAMIRICDTVEAGDEDMFRYNERKVLDWVLDKAQSVVQSGLPASLEERFVSRVLEAPVLSLQREETTITLAPPQLERVENAGSLEEGSDSQSTTNSSTVSAVFSEVSSTTTIVSIPEDTVPTEVLRLQRIRIAFNFICATCIPSYIATRFSALLSEPSTTIDFQPLEDYLKRISALRAEVAASRSLSDFSRKRGLDDDEAAEERAEKKRKQEEEEKRKKANESRGVRDLKKVNVTGMKKMSDFFTKKPVTAKITT